jgi:hypothetical protein
MLASKVRVLRLAHVHYQHPDLQREIDFLVDFGLEIELKEADRVYLRGYGVQPFICRGAIFRWKETLSRRGMGSGIAHGFGNGCWFARCLEDQRE